MKLAHLRWLPLVLFVVAFFVLAWTVANNGFWRHDAWGYSPSELPEFRDNGRWLAPVVHQYTKDIPHYIAWVLSMAMMWGYIHIFITRFLSGSGYESKLLSLSLPFCVIFQPGLIAQLNWPIHSMTAISVLFFMALLCRKRHSLLVSMIGVIITFGLLQSFSFLAVLLAIPNYKCLEQKTSAKLARDFLLLWAAWVFSIGLAQIISKSAQYFYFGEIADIPAWRKPNPAGSITELARNLYNNIMNFIHHFEIVYTETTALVITLSILCAAVYSILKMERKMASIIVWLILTGIALALSMYTFTSPLGVAISLRTTFNIGAGVMLALITLYLIVKKSTPEPAGFYIATASLLLSLAPISISYTNAKWFASVTSDVKDTILEISEVNPRHIDLVVIDGFSAEGRSLWPLDYSDTLPNDKLFIEGLDSSERLVRAFDEAGYEHTEWCNSRSQSPACTEISHMQFSKCSKINPHVCSGGISEGKWYVKF